MPKVIEKLNEQFFQSHVTFTAVPEVVEITKPLAAMGLSYFTFDRTYQDTSHLRLTNAGQWIESYYRTELYKRAIFEKDPRLFANGFVFWSWLNREPVYSAAAEHNIEHGLTLIEKHEHYANFYHFGTTRDNFIPQENLIAQMDYLHHFIAFFKEKMRNTIQTAEATRFILPGPGEKNIQLKDLQQENNPTNIAELLKKTAISRLYLGEEFGDAYLTRREMEILQSLIDGQKTTQIAMKLALSERTLETHIKNIKQKFKCNTLFELGFRLNSTCSSNIYPFKIKPSE